MNKVCDNCKHVVFKDEVHVCPDEEYIKRRDRLLREALDAEDIFGIDALDL